MKSPAKNGKSVLRAMRVPIEIDKKIQEFCQENSLNYSACAIRLISIGLDTKITTIALQAQTRGNLAGNIIAWSRKNNNS